MVEAAGGEEVKDFGFDEDGGGGKGWQKELVKRFGDRAAALLARRGRPARHGEDALQGDA